MVLTSYPSFIISKVVIFNTILTITHLTITYLSYLQNTIYITYNAQNTKYTKLPIHGLLYNTVLKEMT